MFDVETYPNTYFTKKIAKFQVVFILTTFNILTYLVTLLKLTTGLLTGYKPSMPCLFFGLSPNQSINSFEQLFSVWNVSKYGVFSDPYFPAFKLNTESTKYSVWMREIRTRKNSVFGQFSRSVCCWYLAARTLWLVIIFKFVKRARPGKWVVVNRFV